MLRTCFLLNEPIRMNARYINMARSLSRLGPVDLFYIGGQDDDGKLFSSDITLVSCPPRNGLRSRLLRHSSFYKEFDFLFDIVRSRGARYDVVVADDLPTLRPALRVARQSGACLVYSSDEIWVETLNQFFPSDARWPKSVAFGLIVGMMRMLGRRAERALWKDVDLLVTPNVSYRDYLTGRYGARQSCVIMSCPRLGEYPRTDLLRQRLGLPAATRIVLYQGMMNAGRGLDLLVESGRYLEADTVLVLLGHGPMKDRLVERSRKDGLAGRVFFLPPVPYEQLLSHTSSADLGVLLLDRTNLSKQLALANKVFEYMAAGLPLLVSDSPEQAAVVAGAEAGVIVSVGTAEQLGAAINRALANRQQLEAWGKNGRRAFLREFNWEVQETRLLESVRALRSPSAGATVTEVGVRA